MVGRSLAVEMKWIIARESLEDFHIPPVNISKEDLRALYTGQRFPFSIFLRGIRVANYSGTILRLPRVDNEPSPHDGSWWKRSTVFRSY
jgi:hypothetical protein